VSNDFSSNSKAEFLPISALQHFIFCPRRAALVLLEGVWKENVFTAEGTAVHRRAHDVNASELRNGINIARGMELWSNRLGLVGKADIIEFTLSNTQQVEHFNVVEYKRGSPKGKRDFPFHVQVCAQVLCLEEMLGITSSDAQIYYAKVKRRVDLPLTSELRSTTLYAIHTLRDLVHQGKTPVIGYQQRKCDRCSLFPVCMPKAVRPRATASRYLLRVIDNSDCP
jgi:CRISPR-associated exonuclease Cas4